MRLLKVEAGGDFSLVELTSDMMQPYAILSHVWGPPEDEVTFRDLIDTPGKRKAGYSKLEFCAKQAKEDNIDYFWVDTCCIDKSSSAELSEAINSMYRWYDEAAICYAYLSDVSCLESELLGISTSVNFPESKWFTRGWTLQELIAPSNVVFYSKEWRRIGNKSDLADDLSNITGINKRVLGGAHPSVSSIADRMSWAAKRKTTREEDIAYSLLGIFDINMPLLYGEGGKAFLRLQEEIMKTSDDQSIFAWKSSDSTYHAGLLATSPKDFHASRSIISPRHLNESEPSSMTSRGIRATFDLQRSSAEYGTYFALLACHRTGDSHKCAVTLQHIQGDQYIRINPNVLESLGPMELRNPRMRETVYVRQNLFPPLQRSRLLSISRNSNTNDDITWVWIRGTKDLHVKGRVAYAEWYPELALFGIRPPHFGSVLVTHHGSEIQPMSLSFGIRNDRPVCMLDDLANVQADLDLSETSGLGTYDQQLIRKKGYGENSEVFVTARISQVETDPCPYMVVTLCLKTVPYKAKTAFHGSQSFEGGSAHKRTKFM